MLKDLSQIIQQTASSIEEFSDSMLYDCMIPEEFKQSVRKIDNAVISYTNNGFIINSSGLRIYFSNQLWYYAAACADLYNALSEYDNVVKVSLRIDKDTLKSCKDNEKLAESLLPHTYSGQERNFLIKYLSDYSWWSGGKTVDRNDYYYSPVVSTCKLVNASQSYVAEMTRFLAGKPTERSILLSALPMLAKSKKILLFDSTNIVEFMSSCVKEFLLYDNDMTLVKNHWKINTVTIGFTGCQVGKEKSAQDAITDPRRLDDCDKSIAWAVDERKYYFWKEQSSTTLDVFAKQMNLIYENCFYIDITDGYKLYKFISDHKEASHTRSQLKSLSSLPLQTIFYGAPGTGKSYKVNELTKGDDTVIRTTFHPDYDYASFVGCYKPTISRNKKNVSLQTILDYDTLVAKYKELLAEPTSNVNQASTLLGYKYHDSIVQMQNNGHSIAQLVKDAYKDNTTYDTVVRNGMACYEENPPLIQKENQITYSFIPQVFTKAYIKAWEIIAKDEKVTVKVKKEDGTETEQEIFKPVYLVIEEINRGNCAQIFGDIFQLLDRNKNGYSEYPIDIDEDLKNYLVQKLGADSEGIKDGKLCLPPNLNLLATMNTSDQSLFPMDSAFKRRWDWEFVPIRYTAAEAKDDKDNFHTFTITIGDKDKGNVSTYLWTDFLQKVNAKILSVTDSEDKQMGEYFIKKSVDQKTFINKVMYYLWSEVGKDNFNSTNNALFVLPDGLIKETKDGKEEDKKEFSFNELFKENATELLQGFMKKLEV